MIQIKSTNMNDVKNCLISIATGAGTYLTWGRILETGLAIISSIVAGVGVAIIIHYCQVYWWHTKPKKQR